MTAVTVRTGVLSERQKHAVLDLAAPALLRETAKAIRGVRCLLFLVVFEINPTAYQIDYFRCSLFTVLILVLQR